MSKQLLEAILKPIREEQWGFPGQNQHVARRAAVDGTADQRVSRKHIEALYAICDYLEKEEK